MTNLSQANSKAKRHESEQARVILFIIAVAMIVMLTGCSSKEPAVRVEYKDIYVPVKCEIDLPQKPNFSPDDPASARELAGYYKQVEDLLKRCVNE